MVSRMVGVLTLAYLALYTTHFTFDTLYNTGSVWTVINVISAVGIVIALAFSFAHVRAQRGPGPVAVVSSDPTGVDKPSADLDEIPRLGVVNDGSCHPTVWAEGCYPSGQVVVGDGRQPLLKSRFLGRAEPGVVAKGEPLKRS